MPSTETSSAKLSSPVTWILIGLSVVAVGVGLYFLITYLTAPKTHGRVVVSPASIHVAPEEAVMEEAMRVAEGFQDVASPAGGSVISSGMPSEQFQDTMPMPTADTDGSALNQLPSECYPKDVLNSADLLPRDANSLWAQVAPNGQGALSDQNFLTAGYHIGINTVGQTLRNANRQLRSEPPNPQVKVSPWNQTTIDPDINRRPLEIGGSA